MATVETSRQYLETFTETFGGTCEDLEPKELAILLHQFSYILLARAEECQVSKDVSEAAGAAYDSLETRDLLNLMNALVENAKTHV